MIINRYGIVLIALVAMLLGACTGTNNETNQSGQIDIDTSQAEKEIAQEQKTYQVKELIKTLPSPLHISKLFQSAGVSFKEGLVLPNNQSDRFISTPSKALAMGIYSSDLAYATLNGQTDKSIQYLKTVRELSEDLGMGSVFTNQNLMSRFEENISNKDSLKFMLHDLARDSDMYLKETNRMSVVVLTFTGAWIESMYLSMQIVSKDKNNEIMYRALEQKISLKQLLPMMEDYALENEDIKKLKNKLDKLKAKLDHIYKDYPVDNTTEEVTYPDYKMEDIQDLAKDVNEIREYVTSLA